MTARFISASHVKAGIGSVTMDLPPVWAPGDVLLVMSYSPSRAASVPTMGPRTWRHYPSWMYVKVASADEPPPVYTFAADPNTPIGGFVSAWRGVDPAALASLLSRAEYGSVHPGTTSVFDYASALSIDSAVNDTLAVYCYQSESTQARITSITQSGGLALTEHEFSQARITGTPAGWPNGEYCIGLGVYSALKPTPGATGGLRWYVDNDGPHPYYGNQEVSFFSAILFPPAADPGPDLTLMAPGDPVDGELSLTGSCASGATVEVSAPGASVGSVQNPTATIWSCDLTDIPGTRVVITITSGAESVVYEIEGPMTGELPLREGDAWRPVKHVATGSALPLRPSYEDLGFDYEMEG